ncbi:hypothetical protein N7517_002174 [Penicillium concentricum]|uniref:Uncharacterized protein n=1 Tax=Penicillium concentricum TaxID=293559 RepID=A0A9W9VJ95_9EURO|nr:uncharacterized protein N7517_002174 [Penicillium concentricum]KAJ5384263.1 hypothetical protein N7517_002174 [Penicillium concentricum]
MEDPYDKAVVLGLRWSNDDLDLAKPQGALLETFRTQCRFETASLLIPSNSREDAMEAIYDTVDKLRQNPDAVRIPWSSIYLDMKADVLVLIDTSYSGSFLQPCHSLGNILRYSERNAEYLFSTGNEISDQNGPTYDVNNNFTTRLTELLYTASPAPVTVVQLHEALCTQANDPRTKLRYTPQYMDCSKPTIILQHLDNYVWRIENPTSKAQIPIGRVLVSVSVRGNTVRGQARQWQASLSKLDTEVTIEGVFDLQGYFLCLLSMPISLWNSFLHPGYKFMNYEESHNQLATDPSANSLFVATLLERPKDPAYVDYVMLSDRGVTWRRDIPMI